MKFRKSIIQLCLNVVTVVIKISCVANCKKSVQFRIVTAYAMTKNIQSILSPLLILSATGSTSLAWTCRLPLTNISITSLYGCNLLVDTLVSVTFLRVTVLKSSVEANPARASTAKGELLATGKSIENFNLYSSNSGRVKSVS